MRPIQLISLITLLALGTACRQDDKDANAGDAATPESALALPAEQAMPPRETTRMAPATAANGQVIDGRLANDPNFQLPVPGSTMPVRPEDVRPSPVLDSDTVRTALIDGMPESGAGIRVQVSPRGNVTLSGEVATIADRQRAHYLARALPGVAEVDFRDLRVR